MPVFLSFISSHHVHAHVHIYMYVCKLFIKQNTHRCLREIDGGSIINSHSGGGSLGISGSVTIVTTGCCLETGAVFCWDASRAKKEKVILKHWIHVYTFTCTFICTCTNLERNVILRSGNALGLGHYITCMYSLNVCTHYLWLFECVQLLQTSIITILHV